jgi:hypothetical protein
MCMAVAARKDCFEEVQEGCQAAHVMTQLLQCKRVLSAEDPLILLRAEGRHPYNVHLCSALMHQVSVKLDSRGAQHDSEWLPAWSLA